MLTRRNFLVTASATIVCTPAVVRAASLMPVRGIIFPTGRHYFGFVERLYIHCHLPKIAELQNAGLSAHEIAIELNKRKGAAMNGDPWDAQGVIFVVVRNEQIRRTDLILQAERVLNAGT
jgi:hypothetical protein